jgi:hypothetical protein
LFSDLSFQKNLTRIPSGGSIWGISLKERQITEEPMKVKICKKIANPQAFSVEQFVFSDFSFKFSNYTVLEAKCVRNWKSEIL